MKKFINLKRILTASIAVIITLTYFAASAASAAQMKGESTYGFITEYNDFYAAHKDAVDHTVSELLNMNPTVDISEYNLTDDDIEKVVTIATHTHPELFYVSAQYGVGSRYDYSTGEWYPAAIVFHWGKLLADEQTGQYTGEEETYTDDEVLEMRRTFTEKAQWYLDMVDDSMSDFEKALVLHDALIMNSSYLINEEIYSLMVNGRGKCFGYSEVYSYLLAQVGINSEIVESYSMNHQWNKVKIGGNYYHVDVTWDDPTPDKPGFAYHTYFMLSDSEIESLKNPHYDYTSDYPSTDTTYDKRYFNNINTQFTYANGKYYVVDNNKGEKALKTYNMATDSFENVIDFSDKYWDAGGGYAYSVNFMALDVYDGYLYMNDENTVFVYDTHTGTLNTFASNTTAHSFYGLRILDGKVYPALADSPYDQAQLQYIADCLEREYPKGDINGDGAVTIADITALQRAFAEFIKLNSKQLEHADFNGDDIINIRDITAMQRFIAV